MIGKTDLDFTAIQDDDTPRVRDMLDEYDKTCDRDKGESMLKIVDCLRCSAFFETVDELESAYKNLVFGRHKVHVTKVKPELDTAPRRITINVGIETPVKTGMNSLQPLIGEVQLRFGAETTKETIDQIL